LLIRVRKEEIQLEREKKTLHFPTAEEIFMLQGLPVEAASAGVQPASANKPRAAICVAVAARIDL